MFHWSARYQCWCWSAGKKSSGFNLEVNICFNLPQVWRLLPGWQTDPQREAHDPTATRPELLTACGRKQWDRHLPLLLLSARRAEVRPLDSTSPEAMFGNQNLSKHLHEAGNCFITWTFFKLRIKRLFVFITLGRIWKKTTTFCWEFFPQIQRIFVTVSNFFIYIYIYF